MYTMGEEMQWLAKVLPDVAEGNFNSFNAADSSSRTALRQAEQTMAASEKNRNKMVNENLKDMLNNTANQYLDSLEQDIIMLAGTLESNQMAEGNQNTSKTGSITVSQTEGAADAANTAESTAAAEKQASAATTESKSAGTTE